MSTPILHPNSASTSSQIQLKLSQILLQHDSNAKRLYEYIYHVKVFRYNSTVMCWENQPFIEGSLFGYEKQLIINNQLRSSFAFTVINKMKHFLQDLHVDYREQTSKCCLFFEITQNNQYQIYSIHFSNENECQRFHMFIKRAKQTMLKSTSSLNSSENVPVNLVPPSAFANVGSTTTNTRDHLRDILIHLMQTNEEFFEKINQQS